MALTTRQEANYQGKEWWNWAVWLDGPTAELDAVQRVTWHLHPTFPNPERTTTDRGAKFRVESAGWGEFTLRAVIETKDGKRSELSHELLLEIPDTEEHAPMRGMAEPTMSVFVSYSATDERIASALQEALRANGLNVFDPDDIGAGESIESAIHDQVRTADALVALTSSTGARAVQQEIETARRQKTPVIIVDLGESPGFLNPDLPRIPLASERDVPDVVHSLVQQIRISKRRRR